MHHALLVRSISPEPHARSSPIFVRVTYSRGSVLFRRYTLYVYFRFFVDDVIFARYGPYGGVSIPLQRVTPLRRRAQANVPAASCLFRRVRDDGGLRD